VNLRVTTNLRISLSTGRLSASQKVLCSEEIGTLLSCKIEVKYLDGFSSELKEVKISDRRNGKWLAYDETGRTGR
jgi:hypothetical protein